MNTNRENLYEYADDKQFAGKPVTQIFNEIYEQNTWTDDESVSGIGSSLRQTQEIIEQFPIIIRDFEIASFLDVPCGDFNWMRKVNLEGVDYFGADIVEKIVADNNQKFSCEHRKFILLNLIEDEISTFDLIFSRDLFVHFSFADIFRCLNQIKNSGSKYLMTTTFTDQEQNKNIHTGGWRPLNFLRPPFNFPPPIYTLNEKCTEMEGQFSDKSLCLWKIDEI